MIIKTITCHNVYNYGASLQAHALMYYLKKLGNDVEIIDYMPLYIRKNLSLWAIGPRWNRNLLIKLAFYAYVVPIRLLQYKTRQKFAIYNRKYFKLTRRYNSIEELNSDPPQADLFFCGSDQIWNTKINNGLDPAFYCDFTKEKCIKASYAASFSISVLPKEDKQFVKNELGKLDFISVREKSGLNILENLGFTNGIVVVDPVFLKSKEDWLNMCYKPKYSSYILVYDQENNATIKEIAQHLSVEEKKKIVAFKDLYPRNYAHYQEKYTDPIDFISLITYADVVITNSFHCMAFSLIMNKNFFVVPRTHQKVNSRMKDFLDYLHISDRIITAKSDIGKSKKINYLHVNSAIESLRSISEDYINQCLKTAIHLHDNL